MFRLMRYMTKVRQISTSNSNKNTFRGIPSLVFGKYLLHTNIISSGVLMWLGDLCEQELEYRQGKLSERYDYGRMGRMFMVGLSLGPPHHYYYMYLAKKLPKRNLQTVSAKLGLDQFFMGPVCILIFFYGMGILEQKPLEIMNTEIREKFWTVYIADWIVWVPTQFINFYYVPVKYQVIYINGITMIYNVFLSYMKHRKEPHMEDKTIELVNTEMKEL